MRENDIKSINIGTSQKRKNMSVGQFSEGLDNSTVKEGWELSADCKG